MTPERDDGLQQTLARSGLPTRDEVAVRDKRARERRVAEDKQSERFNAWREKNRPAPALTDQDRREAALAGLQRIAKHARGTDAAKINTLIDEASEHLQRHGVAVAELSELESPQTILREHARVVAAKLVKHIGGFTDEEEATGFVLRFWPITAGRVEAARATNMHTKLSRTANEALKSFWSAVERAACLATGKISNEALRECIRAGTL